MNPVFDLLQRPFQRVARTAQRVALAVAKGTATLCDVLRNESVARCVALKSYSTERLSKRCNTATLLFFKNYNSTHRHTYAYAYRGRIGTGFELLRPIGSGCVGAAS